MARETVGGGLKFVNKTPVVAFSYSGTLGTTEQTPALPVPAGIQVLVQISGRGFHSSAIWGILITSPDETDVAVDTGWGLFDVLGAAGAYDSYSRVVRTNTSSQIRARSNQSSTYLNARLGLWTDDRR